MVCRLIEGFESSTSNADYGGKWTTLAASIGTTQGRNGNGMRLNSDNVALRTLDAQATWTLGAAVRPGSVNALTVFGVLDAGTVQASLLLLVDGRLSVTRSTGGAILGTTTVTLPPSIWAYVEWRVTIGDSASTEVRVNGVTALTLAGVDTQQTANATANQIRLGPCSPTTDFDDIYVFDGTGSANTTFAGDCKVEQLLPSGAGATTAWTPSAGANYTCVDEPTAPNADTDYVASSTAAQTDTYAFGNLVTTSGTVAAVQAVAVARKDDAGSRSLALVARPVSTDRVGTTQAVADTYASYAQVWDVSPETATAWTIAEVNGGLWGVRLIA